MHVLDALMIPWVVALETKSFLVLSDQGFLPCLYAASCVSYIIIQDTLYFVHFLNYLHKFIHQSPHFFFIEGMLWNFTILRSMA